MLDPGMATKIRSGGLELGIADDSHCSTATISPWRPLTVVAAACGAHPDIGCEIRVAQASKGLSPRLGRASRRSVILDILNRDRAVPRSPRTTALRPAGLHDRDPIRDACVVGSKSERRAARELVTRYHEAQLAGLLEHVAAIDGHRADALDVHDVDEVIHHYHRAARELWKFCWSGGIGTHIEIVARLIEQPIDDDVDWWQSGAPRERGGR
jgi:hypothetical protein